MKKLITLSAAFILGAGIFAGEVAAEEQVKTQTQTQVKTNQTETRVKTEGTTNQSAQTIQSGQTVQGDVYQHKSRTTGQEAINPGSAQADKLNIEVPTLVLPTVQGEGPMRVAKDNYVASADAIVDRMKQKILTLEEDVTQGPSSKLDKIAEKDVQALKDQADALDKILIEVKNTEPYSWQAFEPKVRDSIIKLQQDYQALVAKYSGEKYLPGGL